MVSKVAAVVLDRDGTLIEDTHYPKNPSDVQWLSGVVEALLLFQRKGYLIFVVSNQSGVGRGLITFDQFSSVHNRFQELVVEAGVSVEEYHYCFDSPQSRGGGRPSPFRKPATGMLPFYSKAKQIDWSRSFAVGDRLTDLTLGTALGVSKSFLVGTGLGEKTVLELPTGHPFQVRSQLIDIANEIPNLLP